MRPNYFKTILIPVVMQPSPTTGQVQDLNPHSSVQAQSQPQFSGSQVNNPPPITPRTARRRVPGKLRCTISV